MRLADPSIVPRGLSRAQAAAYVGIGTTLFDRLVTAGKMPHPREIGGRRIWDRHEVDMAFDDLPHVDEATATVNRWNEALASTSLPHGPRSSSGERPPHSPDAYSPACLAKRWNCSKRHVRNLIRRGDLEAMHLGGKLLRITRAVVETYEAKNDGAGETLRTGSDGTPSQSRL